MRGFDYKKTTQALNFFAKEEGGEINKMKALKLIWLSDRKNAALFGRTITGDSYFAMKNGPVASATRDILEESSFLDDVAKDYSNSFIKSNGYEYVSIGHIDEEVFSDSDINTIREIYKAFGNKDKFALSDISHEFPEWKKYESALRKRLSSRFEISIEEFFETNEYVEKCFNITKSELELSKQIFLINENFSSAL
jgi:uncharacterized phage-associated protein